MAETEYFMLRSEKPKVTLERIRQHEDVENARLSDFEPDLIVVVAKKIFEKDDLKNTFQDQSLSLCSTMATAEPGHLLTEQVPFLTDLARGEPAFKKACRTMREHYDKNYLPGMLCEFLLKCAHDATSTESIFVISYESCLGLGLNEGGDVDQIMENMKEHGNSVPVERVLHRRSFDGKEIINPVTGRGARNTCLLVGLISLPAALMCAKLEETEQMTALLSAFFMQYVNENANDAGAPPPEHASEQQGIPLHAIKAQSGAVAIFEVESGQYTMYTQTDTAHNIRGSAARRVLQRTLERHADMKPVAVMVTERNPARTKRHIIAKMSLSKENMDGFQALIDANAVEGSFLERVSACAPQTEVHVLDGIMVGGVLCEDARPQDSLLYGFLH